MRKSNVKTKVNQSTQENIKTKTNQPNNEPSNKKANQQTQELSNSKTTSTKKALISQFYRNNKKYFAISIVMTILSASMGIILSWILQQLTDVATKTSPLSFQQVIIVLGVFLLALILIEFSDARIFPRYVRNASTNYKNFILARIINKGITDFSSEDSSRYVTTLTADASSIEEKYIKSNINILTYTVSFFAALGMMLYYSPMMTLVSAILTVLPIIASMITGNKLIEVEKNISQRNASFIATISDFTKGFPLVKNFKAEAPVLDNLLKSNVELENDKESGYRTKLSVRAISGIAGAISQLGVALFGVYLILQEGTGFTLGMMIVFINLMNYIIQPIANLPGIISERKAAVALIEKAAELIDSNAVVEGDEDLGKLQNSIKLENINFAYEEDKTILKDINLEFEKGKSYALVGASGSGKSTLLKLLMNEVRPDSGDILYDGIELNAARLDSVYEEISMIQQNVFIFNASILDNITMFQDFPADEVQEVIRRSSLDKLIADKGMDYLCGENGKNLSGGEKQRISIARALLKDSSIILTDEATSSLDKETSYQITKDILGLTEKTRIMVTHTLDESLLKKYDQIIVLRDGKVVEQGSFEELLANDNYFKSFYSIS